jgi:uncharacterized protein YjbI with pentapeptide repeats
MNQDQQPRLWWRDKRLVWVLAALVLIWLLTITILFLFPLPTIPSLFSWRSWDWRWLVLLGLIFLSAGVLYLTMRRVWYRLFNLIGFRGKTLWDLMSLLIVPIVIALAGWWLSEVSRQNQQKIEDQRAKAEQEIETDRARESVLQSYIQNMTDLLLDKGLATSDLTHPVRSIARSSTLTTLRQLDADRKGILLQFLHESNLITVGDPIIILSDADLTGANLTGAFLREADLFDADLTGAILRDAGLTGADLRSADLIGADLHDAHLSRAELRDAHLTGADLRDAYLFDADLTGADLTGAILISADLRGAKGWTNEQLAQAESLVGATLPNGTEMNEEGWEEFKKSYRQ